MKSSETTFSVIIITRNRAAVITPTLVSLGKIEYPAQGFEVIVVDNGSTDTTPHTVTETLKRAPFQWELIDEPVEGLCSARNAGLIQANGEWVVYLDDDAQPTESWLAAYAKATKAYPQAVAMGGPVKMAPNLRRPWWWCSRFDWFMSCQDYGKEPLIYPRYKHPYGLNMAMRRSTLLHQGGFDTRMDELTDNLADETELFLRLWKSHQELVYVPDSLVVHYLQPERLHWSSFQKRCRLIGHSHACLEYLHGVRLQNPVWRMFLNAIYDTIQCPSPAHVMIAWQQWHGYRHFRQPLELGERPSLPANP